MSHFYALQIESSLTYALHHSQFTDEIKHLYTQFNIKLHFKDVQDKAKYTVK